MGTSIQPKRPNMCSAGVGKLAGAPNATEKTTGNGGLEMQDDVNRRADLARPSQAGDERVAKNDSHSESKVLE